MSTIQPLTRDELAQIRQWYADKARDLPRKVVRDVAALLDHITCQTDARRAALEDTAEQLQAAADKWAAADNDERAYSLRKEAVAIMDSVLGATTPGAPMSHAEDTHDNLDVWWRNKYAALEATIAQHEADARRATLEKVVTALQALPTSCGAAYGHNLACIAAVRALMDEQVTR